MWIPAANIRETASLHNRAAVFHDHEDAYKKWSDVSEEQVITILKQFETLHQAS